ncbi:MAG: amidase, partial [Steroidobacteraceae bacterium]
MSRSLVLLKTTVCSVSLAVALALPLTASAAKIDGFHLEEATIDDIQQALLAKKLTTVQLVELYLKRIKAYNGTCVKQPKGILGPITPIANAGQLNALQTLNLRPATRKKWGFDERKARSLTDKADDDPAMPDALQVAAAQDEAFAETGKLVGPLQGVVLAFKDQYDTFDMRTTSGADVPYANDRPPADATFIKRLREAGAIILAKANLVEYAGGTSPRSSFGGVFCNAYDTTRSPSGSSSGSGSSVAANLVTCAIAEETGSSVRGPARAANSVGISPTQELVSRDGMIGLGINTRVGPICRTVEDAAKILDAFAGYDSKDPLTVFSIGRKPTQPYASFTQEKSLSGVRIGVVREYMDKSKFTKTDEQTIDLVEAATKDLGKLGATIVDPGAGGALFTGCMKQYLPQLDNKLFTKRFAEQFPVDAQGKPTSDHIAKLVDMTMDPASVPEITLRDLGGVQAVGESKFQMNLYLRRRGDANIQSNTDLLNKSTFYDDPQFTDRRAQRANMEKPMEVNMAERMQRRFVVQEMILQCMAEQRLDALVYPTTNLPPAVLGQPDEPPLNGRGGAWSFLGQQGFPAVTVPAGFTSAVYDRVRDPNATKPEPIPEGMFAEGGREPTRLIGPVA